MSEQRGSAGILICACGHSEFVHQKKGKCHVFKCQCDGYVRQEKAKEDKPDILELVRKIREQGGAGENERFITAKDLCFRYGVSRLWPYHSKEMMAFAYKIGRLVRWKLSEIEAYERYCQAEGSNTNLIYFKENAQWKREQKVKILIK